MGAFRIFAEVAGRCGSSLKLPPEPPRPARSLGKSAPSPGGSRKISGTFGMGALRWRLQAHRGSGLHVGSRLRERDRFEEPQLQSLEPGSAAKHL